MYKSKNKKSGAFGMVLYITEDNIKINKKYNGILKIL